MSVLSKQRVKSAAPRKSKMSLDSNHITTSDFMCLQPVYYRHMIPGENLNVNVTAISRLAPLAVPTYGRANLNLRAFYIPYRTINPTFNEFISDTIYSNYSSSSIPAGVPLLKASVLRDAFHNNTYLDDLGTTPPANPSDVYAYGHYWNYTSVGRRKLKILESLGYKIVWNDKGNFDYNALGLLAYARVYMDWYSLGQYLNEATYLAIQKLFNYNDPSTPLNLSSADLFNILSIFDLVSYDQDYFTSQWDNPVSPVSGLTSPIPTIEDNTITSSTVSMIGNDAGVPIIKSVDNSTNPPTISANVANLSENTLHLLHAINNYVKGHQMSGARAIDRLLVDYGIQLRSERLNRSTYLGSYIQPIQIGDVTSTANTSSDPSVSNLGDFAGRGFSSGQNSFQYEAEEFGMFLICSSIIPAIGYTQGFDRHNLHVDRFDFYNGRFDNCGTQATAKGELFISGSVSFAGQASDYLRPMGFLPRYAEYKVGKDYLTGDFALDSAHAGRNSWHLFRRFNEAYFNSSVNNVVHSFGFCNARNDHGDFDRIFQNTDNDFDHFYNFFHFEVTSMIPALPLYDTYVFDNEENKESVIVEANGSKLN